jgi:hypothetical protein
VAVGSSGRISLICGLYRPSRFKNSITRSSNFTSSGEQLSWTCVKSDKTFVIGASRGSEDNFARLVLRKPSDAIERMSKLPRRIEWRDPRGSFACGIEGRPISWLLLCCPVKLKTKWVVDFPRHATGHARTWSTTGSCILRLNDSTPSNSLSLFVWFSSNEMSELMRSCRERPTTSSYIYVETIKLREQEFNDEKSFLMDRACDVVW